MCDVMEVCCVLDVMDMWCASVCIVCVYMYMYILFSVHLLSYTCMYTFMYMYCGVCVLVCLHHLCGLLCLRLNILFSTLHTKLC